MPNAIMYFLIYMSSPVVGVPPGIVGFPLGIVANVDVVYPTSV